MLKEKKTEKVQKVFVDPFHAGSSVNNVEEVTFKDSYIVTEAVVLDKATGSTHKIVTDTVPVSEYVQSFAGQAGLAGALAAIASGSRTLDSLADDGKHSADISGFGDVSLNEQYFHAKSSKSSLDKVAESLGLDASDPDFAIKFTDKIKEMVAADSAPKEAKTNE